MTNEQKALAVAMARLQKHADGLAGKTLPGMRQKIKQQVKKS